MKLIRDLGMILLSEKSKRKERYGIYECPHCNQETRARVTDVKRGKVARCKKCSVKQREAKHGFANTRIYTAWLNMKARCSNKNNKFYKNYGGRGISVSKEWSKDFMTFYNWAKKNGYSDDLTIDRIDNDGNYEPDNCRWVTMKVQGRNTRTIQSNNTTGYRGVILCNRSNRFIAQIGIIKNGKRFNKYIGKYDTAEKASIAYDTYIHLHMLEHTQNRKLERVKL